MCNRTAQVTAVRLPTKGYDLVPLPSWITIVWEPESLKVPTPWIFTLQSLQTLLLVVLPSMVVSRVKRNKAGNGGEAEA